jgi:DNA repair protein RecN (Recombination protein N)
MLIELSIRNLAVVEEVSIAFKKGFHVLTGETGAGKSIIIDALGLLIGGRASAELVRHGTDRAEIEACFELSDDHPVRSTLERLGISSEEEHVIIRREITAQGKSSSRINGQMVNLGMLKEVGEYLVNIHGQHEHQSLLKVEKHLDWLDLFGDKAIGPIKAEYQGLYRDYIELKRELVELEEKSKNALQLLDLYRYQAEEIGQARLKPGEDELLNEEKRKLANAEKLFQSANDGYEALYGNAKGLDYISKSIQRMENIVQFDRPVLGPMLEQMQSAYYQLEDAAYQLRDYRDRIEFNPARLEQIEKRLDVITQLRRKYGTDATEILSYYDKILSELSAIENKDEHVEKLRAQLEQLEKKLISSAARLTEVRKAAAKQLASDIEQELRDLYMARTKLEVRVDSEHKLGPTGWDEVEFLISPNPGEPLRSLHKIASGGELSRIMLAMKAIFARMDQIPVLVFDEVDTGVSGRAAQAIADKLSILARSCQVFSITHLPQVACMADAHYEVRKEIEGERTYTRVEELLGDIRVKELARMLGGVEVTDTTEKHAQEMLLLADQKKSKQ